MDGDKTDRLPAAADDQASRPSRRQVLYGAGAGLGLAALAPVLGRERGPVGRVTARAAAGRSMDFGQDWKFVLVNPNGTNDPTGAYQNAYQPGFDDSSWQVLRTSTKRDHGSAPAGGCQRGLRLTVGRAGR